MALHVVERLAEEEPALAGRVRRLEHGGKPDRSCGGTCLLQGPDGGEARLRDAGVGELPPHRDLVRHQVCGLGPDPRQVERLGDGSDDRYRTIGRVRQHPVDAVPTPGLDDGRDVEDVHDLAGVGDREPRCVGVPVDRDDSHAQLA